MGAKRWLAGLIVALCAVAILAWNVPAAAQGEEGAGEIQEVPEPPKPGDPVDQYRYAIECYLLALAILNDENPLEGGRMKEPQLKSELYKKLFGAYNALAQECRKRDDLFNAVAVYADAINRFPSPLVAKPPETAGEGEGAMMEAGGEGEGVSAGAISIPSGPVEYWTDISGSLRAEMLEYLKVLHNGFCEVLCDLRLNDLAYEQAQYALVMDPSYDLALGNAAKLAVILGYLEEGRDYASWLKDLSPRSARAECDLALANRRMGRNREAIFHYLQCLRIDPEEEDGPGNNLHPHVVALNGLGVIYLQNGQLVDAEREFDKAIAKGEQLVEYLRQKPKRLARLRRQEREGLTSVILAYVNQSIVYRRQGRLEEATRLCRRAVEIGEWLVHNGIREDEIIDNMIEDWNARAEAQGSAGGAGAFGGEEEGGEGGVSVSGGDTVRGIVEGLISSATTAAAAAEGGEEEGATTGGFGAAAEEGEEGTTAVEAAPPMPTVEEETREVHSIALANAGLCYRDRGVKAMAKRHGDYDPGGSTRMLYIAADYLERAVTNDPDNAEALNNLGEVYMQLRRWEDAQWAFTRAVAAAQLKDPAKLELYQANLEAVRRRLQ